MHFRFTGAPIAAIVGRLDAAAMRCPSLGAAVNNDAAPPLYNRLFDNSRIGNDEGVGPDD